MKAECPICGENKWRLDLETPRLYCDMCGETMPRKTLLKMLGLKEIEE